MSKRRRSSGSRRVAEAKFWGEAVDDANHPVSAGTGSESNGSEGSGSEGSGSVGSGSEGNGSEGNGFEGDRAEGAEGAAKARARDAVMVRPTPDPGALVRSLGAPPLAVDAGLAERHLTAVYEEAVRAATALAAASGLLALDADDA